MFYKEQNIFTQLSKHLKTLFHTEQFEKYQLTYKTANKNYLFL